MVKNFPRYNDDEVQVFHPFFEYCANEALKKLNLSNALRVVHHPSFGGITADFCIERRESKKIILLVEIKRTKSALGSTRSRHQALSYRHEADHLCETPYYALTNIENTDLLRYDTNKPRVSSQLIKGSPFSCGNFNDGSLQEFLERYINHLSKIICLSITDTGEYDESLDCLYNHLKSKESNHKEWHKLLMPFSFEYIRGASLNYTQLKEKINSSNWQAADSYLASPESLSKKGLGIDFSHIFKEPYPAPNSPDCFEREVLESAYKNGTTRVKGDDVSQVVYDILAPNNPGIVETDQELASLLAILSKIELGRPLINSEVVTDPAAGSGRLLTAAASNAFPEIEPSQIWANEIEPRFSEALSLRLGLQFGDSVSINNYPKITIEDISCLTKDAFLNTKVVLLNPPYISGINSANERKSIAAKIKSLSGYKSKTNVGQIGLEGPFLELILNLVPENTIIAAIMPFVLLTRKSPEFQLYRKFLLNEFGLKIVCCYPRKGLFEDFQKRTCIFVGCKKSSTQTIKWIDIDSPIERLDLHETELSEFDKNRLVSVSNLDQEYLTNNIKSGWINDIKKSSKEWFMDTLLKQISYISNTYTGIKRGTSGNSGASKLSAIPKDDSSLINIIPESNRIPAINSAKNLPKYLDAENAPCVSPLIIEGQENYFITELIENYLLIEKNKKPFGKQKTTPLTFEKVKRSISRDIQAFPAWSVLIPRLVRRLGNTSIISTPFNISTNFMVIPCHNKINAIITASWLFSIFGQIQMEFLCSDQEGARKLEYTEISRIYLPNDLDRIRHKFYNELEIAFELSTPIDYKNIQLRQIDEVWAHILHTQPDNILEECLSYLQDLVNERDP